MRLDGNKISYLIIALFLVAIVSNMFVYFKPEPDAPPAFEPLLSSTITVESQVPDSPIPQIINRQPVIVHAKACASEKVSEKVDLTFIRTDTDSGIISIPSLQDILINRESGCSEGDIRIGIPSSVSAGTWVIVVQEQPTKGNQILSSTTPPFEIK